MKFYTTHFLKFSIIKLIYFFFRLFNIKKFFFENDFEMKKNSYHNENIIEKKLLKSLSEKFVDIEKKNKIIRDSQEIKKGKNLTNWYEDDLLYKISLKYSPTKRRHDYLKRYNFHFYPIREKVKKILEIGVDKGESLYMWEEYFPNAEIHGLDINKECEKFNKGRVKIHIGDQSNKNFLNDLGEKNNFFDIIIDDGSHIHDHIIKSFTSLYPFLKNGGYYVVEDVVNNYDTTNFFARYAFGINYYPTNKPTVDEPGYKKFDIKNCEDIKNVVGLNFYRHLIFLKKGFNPEENPFKNIIEDRFIY
tara:strand:- start:7 stop:918 length:912 start_codon:yes stop_codon:yes gene_type:complete